MNHYGQISLTKLGDFVRKHPELVREVKFQDGHVEKLLPIDVKDRKEPGKYGDVAYISAYDKASGDKAYIADLKVSRYAPAPENASQPHPVDEKAVAYLNAATQSANPEPLPLSTSIGTKDVDDLPF
jgi:hypothetical protein